MLKPGEGWHRYQFTAAETGAIAFQMQAPAAQADLWPYLLINEAAAVTAYVNATLLR